MDKYTVEQVEIDEQFAWKITDTTGLVVFVEGDVRKLQRVIRALELADLMSAVKTLGY